MNALQMSANNKAVVMRAYTFMVMSQGQGQESRVMTVMVPRYHYSNQVRNRKQKARLTTKKKKETIDERIE